MNQEAFSSASSVLQRMRREIEQRRADPDYQRRRDAELKRRYSCIKCCDAGEYSVRDESAEGWPWRTVQCDECALKRARAKEERRLQGRRHYADTPGGLADATFDSFERRDPVLLAAWTRAANYARGVDSWPWLVFVSNEPGTGKSHLAAAIANYRAAHVDTPPAKWLSVVAWLDHLRDGFSDGSYRERLEVALSAPCLILDDFGAEYHRNRLGDNESWASERLYHVLNHRYERRMETVITSNVGMTRLPPRIRSRISDTGTKLSRIVVMETASYRSG